MKPLAMIAEVGAALLIGLLTIGMLLLGTVVGIGGSARYLRIRSL